jgi:hypothetical protein
MSNRAIIVITLIIITIELNKKGSFQAKPDVN